MTRFGFLWNPSASVSGIATSRRRSRRMKSSARSLLPRRRSESGSVRDIMARAWRTAAVSGTDDTPPRYVSATAQLWPRRLGNPRADLVVDQLAVDVRPRAERCVESASPQTAWTGADARTTARIIPHSGYGPHVEREPRNDLVPFPVVGYAGRFESLGEPGSC